LDGDADEDDTRAELKSRDAPVHVMKNPCLVSCLASDSDSVYWTCSQKVKNQKAKQTIMHSTTKQYNTRQEMKWNAMQCNGKK